MTTSSVVKPTETILIHSAELNRMMGKRTKSSNDINQIKTFKSLPPVQCRLSELELIFQVIQLVHIRWRMKLLSRILHRIETCTTQFTKFGVKHMYRSTIQAI
jgi:hypothetical protein